MNSNELTGQGGATLVVTIIIVAGLSALAMSVFESSRFAFNMSANRLYYEQAFNHAESSRKASMAIIPALLGGDDLEGLSVSPSLTFEGSALADARPAPTIHYQSGRVNGEVRLIAGRSSANRSGAGIAQFMGYSGLGVGQGAKGSLVKYYEIRSAGSAEGIKNKSMKVCTASDYRFIP